MTNIVGYLVLYHFFSLLALFLIVHILDMGKNLIFSSKYTAWHILIIVNIQTAFRLVLFVVIGKTKYRSFQSMEYTGLSSTNFNFINLYPSVKVF